ncbi:hypothetical protein D3C79_1005180 [compost metagenome]
MAWLPVFVSLIRGLRVFVTFVTDPLYICTLMSPAGVVTVESFTVMFSTEAAPALN